MKFKLISSTALLIFAYSSIAQKNIITTNQEPRYRASIQTVHHKIVKGLLLQLEDSSVILYLGNRKEFRKGRIHDSVLIAYSQVHQINLKKQNGLVNGFLIGGGIGLAPVVFGEGGAYVAILTFPIGIITGSIVGASGKTYNIDGKYFAFKKMKKKIKKYFQYSLGIVLFSHK
ncbi:MAG: hypothetical protein ABI325_04185 [Ginsengibacter sp.]